MMEKVSERKSKSLILPSHLRKELKEPLGELVNKVEKSSLRNEVVICVGDRASERILKLGLSPKICIYDGKIKRKEVEISPAIKNFDAKEFQVKNPAGRLNKEVFQRISQGLKSKNSVKIHVEGEEDLCALAAIHLSPLNFIVVYGQPDEGLVVVKVDKEIKEKVGKFLEEMKKENEH